MLIIAVRTLILYSLVLFAVRIMGKSELSKMSSFQMVILFMIAELAAIPIDDSSVSLLSGVVSIFTLMFLQILFSHLSIRSDAFRDFITGKPSVLIENGRLNVKELKKLRITTTDLMEQLRLENCPSVSDVQYAILESNGQLSVIPKAASRPVTPRDMHLAVAEGSLPVILVSDGALYPKNLFLSGISESDFQNRLSSHGIHSYQQIFMAFCDQHKTIHVYLHTKEGQSYAQEVKL